MGGLGTVFPLRFCMCFVRNLNTVQIDNIFVCRIFQLSYDCHPESVNVGRPVSSVGCHGTRMYTLTDALPDDRRDTHTDGHFALGLWNAI